MFLETVPRNAIEAVKARSKLLSSIACVLRLDTSRKSIRTLSLCENSDENLQMLSRTSTQNKPLTPLMLAALQHLAARRDQGLVRLYSNYWIAESEEKNDPLFREMQDLNDRLLATGSFLHAHQQPILVIQTSTVKAMAARGLLKFIGPKRIVRGTGNRKDYARAVLTSQATAIRGEMEDQSLAVYEDVLRRLR